MGRNKISPEEKKIALHVMIESKYVTKENRSELQTIAYNAILTHLSNENKNKK